MAIPFLSDIRLPSSGKVYLWTGHNSNFLQYNLWHASASGGMFIKNISSSGDIYFQTNSTTALTLDSSQNATFAGNVEVQNSQLKIRDTSSNHQLTLQANVASNARIMAHKSNLNSDQNLDIKATQIDLYSGSISGSTNASTLLLDSSKNATFAGSITAPSSLNFTANTAIIKVGSSWNTGKFQFLNGPTTAIEFDIPNNRIKNNLGKYLTASGGTGQFGSFDNHSMSLVTNNTARLTIDNSGNATFTSDVTVNGGDIYLALSGSTQRAVSSTGTNSMQIGDAGTQMLRFKNASGVALDIAASGDATFSGGVTFSGASHNVSVTSGTNIRGSNHLFLQGDASYVQIKSPNNYIYYDAVAHNFRKEDGTAAYLVINATNATFSGDIHVGANYIGRDGDNYIGFVTDNLIKFRVNGATQVKLSDGVFAPQTDSDIDLGSNGTRFANVYADTLHGTVAEANNLQSFDDRDIAPEDLSFSDDLKLFFAEKTGIEGGTVGSDWQDLLILSSYVDSSGGKLNALALDKSEHRILHYNANHNATNWGTAKELAYTSDFVKRTGGSSTSMSGDLHIIAGAPRIYLQDNTDDDDQQIVFRNSSGVDDYKITTQDFTGAGAGDGMFIGSENADQVALVTNDTIALTIDTSQHVSLPGAYLTLNDISSHAQIEATSSSMFLKAANIQMSGNLIPDGTGNRNLGASNRYWAETYTNGVTSGGNIVINSNTPVLTLGVLNTSTGNSKIQFYSKNSGTSNGFAIQYNKDTSIDRLEFIDGGGTAAFQFHNGGNAEFEGSLTASQINTGQGATEVHLMNQNLRTTDDVTFDDLTVTGNFTVTGTVNTVSSTNLVVQDKTITVGKNQTESASGGSGLIVDGSGASILWDETNDTWDFNKGIYITGNDGNVNLDGNGAIIFDNTNNNNGWYIRNGGSNVATLQFGLGTTPGSNIKHTFAGDGSVTFATYVNAATGFRMASGQAIDFIDSNIGYNSIERNTTVGGLQINTGDSASVNILDDGKVGIGTSSPYYILDTRFANTNTSFSGGGSGNWGSNGIRIENTSSTANTMAAIHLRNSDADIHIAGIRQGTDDSDLGFFFESLEKVRFTKDGNVGIGTTSPNSLLHLASSTGPIITLTDTDPSIGVDSIIGHIAFVGTEIGGETARIGAVSETTGGEAGLRFYTGSSVVERLRITKDGLVGIGETSPSHKITATSGTNGRIARLGNLEITTQSGTYTGSSIEVTGSNSFITYKSTLGHKFVTRTSGGGNTLEALTIVPDTGNVGIGDTAPLAKLHVTASAITGATATTFGHVMIEDTDAQIDLVSSQSGTWGSAINFKEHNTSDSNNNDIWSIARKTTGDAGDSSLNFNFGTSNQHDNANKVNFSSTGKITTAGGVNYTGGTIATATTVLHTNNIVYNIGGSNGIILSNADYSDRYYITNSDHRWEVASADAMRLNSTGLGIGTTSPAYKLDVAGDIKCTTSLKIDAGSPFLGLYNSGTEKAYLQWSQSNDYLTLQSDGDTRFITVGTERIRIKSDGKVGIGTTGPTYKLSVPSGGIEAGGKITYSKSAGSLNATGYAVAGITAAANGNGSSCGFVFTCFGHVGAYQRIVYSCYNGSGTWYAKKVIDEGTNQLDVVASANGSTITFTFKATDSTMSYTPRVTVEATGHNINSTYA